jgi:hypothetical protein
MACGFCFEDASSLRTSQVIVLERYLPITIEKINLKYRKNSTQREISSIFPLIGYESRSDRTLVCPIPLVS